MSPILTAAEGLVLGLAVKMFTIAGPVLVYGTVASVVYGGYLLDMSNVEINKRLDQLGQALF